MVSIILLSLFPLGRYKVKFYNVKWAFNYVDVDVLSAVESKWYLNLLLYIKIYIFGTALYMGAVLIMLYLDTLGIFKGPHVLLVFAYWILLTVLLYKRRNKKVNPPENRRPSRLSHTGTEKNEPAISEMNPEKHLQLADHCPYCAVGVTPRKGENHCPNCNITYTVTDSNRVSDNTRPLIDIFRTLFFVFAITCHTVFFVIFWEIDLNIVFNNNSLFLLMLPWVIHYLLFLYIAYRYGFIIPLQY